IFLYGKNGHHLLESAAKSAGIALGAATRRRGMAIRSTKGGLD
ncbi:MAG: imidazoleglycerol-phosphate dehydratase, partial [Desulfovibrio sp.]|nr:imidazoleglycerol-phosphate dehydratase [Desulfovibrio sp.]